MKFRDKAIVYTMLSLLFACPGENNSTGSGQADCASDSDQLAQLSQRLEAHFPDRETIIQRLTGAGRIFVSGPARVEITHGMQAYRFVAGDAGDLPTLIRMSRTCTKVSSPVCGFQGSCFTCGSWTEWSQGKISIDDKYVLTAEDMTGLPPSGIKVIRFRDRYFLAARVSPHAGHNILTEMVDYDQTIYW